jgi:ADP-ribosylglycohydrolase
MLATAMVDALGGPAEFQGRFTFDPVTTMIPNENFDLEPGVWTDDTSMMLCLARSIAHSKTAKDRFDERSQLEAYLAWFHRGELSAIGRCFDIGGTINRALGMFHSDQDRPIEEILGMIRSSLGANVFSGNGSLMRVLPIGLAYWRDENQAREYANRSSCTTHPSPLCIEACEVWTMAIAKMMQAVTAGKQYSKLDVLEHFALYPYSNPELLHELAIPTFAKTLPVEVSLAEKEGYYWLHLPLLQKITRVNKGESSKEIPGLPYPMPSVEEVPSTGFVLHSLVAALYCFMSTLTFEEGALMAVNMGNDADTVGAIYAGLAGVWYAEEEPSGRFWTERVIAWKEGLVERSLVEKVASELATFSEKSGLNP